MIPATALTALLLGAAALQDGVYLDVPFVRQSPRHCGAAALAMSIRYWDHDVDHNALAAAMRGTATGATGADLERVAQAHGFVTRAFVGTDERLGELLRSGRPVIVALAPAVRTAPHHFVVVVGMTSHEWIVHDPSAGPYRRIERAAFAARWKRLNAWALLVDRPARVPVSPLTDAPTASAAQPFWELASAHFREGRYGEARKAVRDGLDLAPSDAYGHEFLATLLQLEGRTLEALHHWNAAGGPIVRTIEYRDAGYEAADTLSRLHRINEGEPLTHAQWIDALWRQTQLMPRHHAAWRLVPAEDDDWSLRIESAGATSRSWRAQLFRNTVSAVADRRLSLDLGGAGISQVALGLRWQPADRRISAEWRRLFVTPQTDRLRLSLDVRDERWTAAAPAGRERVRSADLSASYDYFMSSRRLVSTRLGMLRHTAGTYVVSGASWQQTVALDAADSLRAHWSLEGDVFLPAGSRARAARRVVASAALRWQQPHGTTALGVRSTLGAIAGGLPRDRQFVLGIGSDSSLPLRAHPVVHEGAKGGAPVGTRFGLVNVEADRRLFRIASVEARALVFADHAVVGRRTYLDAGAGLRLPIAEQTIDILAGRDMRTGSVRFWSGLSRTF